MPPQHGKSELVGDRRFPAFMLGRSPNLRLIAASHTHELTVAFGERRLAFAFQNGSTFN